MAAEKREHEVKVRLTQAERARVLTWAGGEPLAVRLRRLALGEAPDEGAHPRRTAEIKLHPQAAELVRYTAALLGELKYIADALENDPRPPPETRALLSELAQIKTAMRQLLEAAQC